MNAANPSKPVFEDIESERLANINDRIDLISEMCRSERLFLNGIIRHLKPTKLLEVGVSAGGSSAIMLNAIADIPDAMLYSHDYSREYYRDRAKLTGFVIKEKCPEFLPKWRLSTGGLVAEHLDRIGGDIDFVLLDTTHVNPGEFLDFLMVLPYLKPGAVLVIHDISLHLGMYDWCRLTTTCGTLFVALRGEKHVPERITDDAVNKDMLLDLPLPNIGAVVLAPDIREMAAEYFHLLSLPWTAKMSESDYAVAVAHLNEHYGPALTGIFRACVERQHARLDAEKQAKVRQPGKGGGRNHGAMTTKIRVLGLPLFTIKRSGCCAKVLLFGRIPLVRIKHKS